MYYESEIFKNFLAFMGSHGPIHNLILKQSGTNLILIKENVRSLAQARGVLQNILQTIGETHVASTEQAEIS
jgi:hypothetical protein